MDYAIVWGNIKRDFLDFERILCNIKWPRKNKIYFHNQSTPSKICLTMRKSRRRKLRVTAIATLSSIKKSFLERRVDLVGPNRL